MQKGRKLWEKVLSLVLAVVCCVGIMNLSPLADTAKAANTDVYIFMDNTTGAVAPKTNVYGGGGSTGWKETADYTLVKETENGKWYKTTYDIDTGNNIYIYDGSMKLYGNGSLSSGVSNYFVVTSNACTKVDENTANNQYGLGGGSTQPSTFTFTLKDGTDSKWLSGTKDNTTAYFKVVVNNQTTDMTKVDETTWTVTLPANVGDFTINRCAPDGGVWNSWNVSGSSRGTNTTYTATGNGVGQWGTSTEPSTQPTTQPSTEGGNTNPSGPSGTWTGDKWSYDFDNVEFNHDSVKNNSDKELYLAPSVLYDYKETRIGKTNGNDVYNATSTSGINVDWNFQFASLNKALMEYYNSKGIETHMLIGGFDSLRIADGHALSDFVGYNELNYYDWALNHNLTRTVANTAWTGDVWTIYGVNEDNQKAAMLGIAGETLSNDGNILVRDSRNSDSGYSNIMPYFDNDFLLAGGKYNNTNQNRAAITNTVAFPFRYDEADGYYKFDSNNGTDNVYYNPDTRKLEYSYQTNRVYDYGETYLGYWDNNNQYRWDAEYGFFPFNTTDNSHNNQQGYISYPADGNKGWAYAGGINEPPAKAEAQSKLNFGNGLRVDIPFTISANGKDDNGRDTVFNFTGDDDLWVYVDGKLVLDMGGAHTKASGHINFTTGEVTIDSAYDYVKDWPGGGEGSNVYTPKTSSIAGTNLIERNTEHTLTIFYMERGLFRSNLSISFNFAPISLEASDTYYAEIGTPITMDVPDDFKELIKNTNYTVTSSDGGTVTYEDGSFKYTSDKTKEKAFSETVTVTFDDEGKSKITYEINNYKMNDDVYVIDYGLPVELHTNDEYDLFNNDELTLGSNVDETRELKLSNETNKNKGIVSKYTASEAGLTLTDEVNGNSGYGKAKVTGANYKYDSYKYTLNKFLDDTDTFYYAVQVVAHNTASGATLSAKNATPVMTSKVTIVPASVVYYEDDFSFTSNDGTKTGIIYGDKLNVVNNTSLNFTQSNSWDDLYGFDEAFKNIVGDSANQFTTIDKNSGFVQFAFKGTGFDVVARANNESAAVLYMVVNDAHQLVEMGIVDTYFNNGTAYQLPVISKHDLDYGDYTVRFMIAASSVKDVFYFDGVRIYNPLGTSSDYYKDSNENRYENGAKAESLIKLLENDQVAITTTNKNAAGNAVLEDLKNTEVKSGAELAEILSYGPSNEIYLNNESQLAFYANPNDTVTKDGDRTLQVEIKAVAAGNTATGNPNLSFGGNTINTNTAMYYNVPLGEYVAGKGYLVVLPGAKNSDYVLSYTNIKVKGYDISAFKPEISKTGTYISNVTIKTDAKKITKQSEVEFEVKFSNSVSDLTRDNIKVTGNGHDVTIIDISKIDDSTYTIKTKAANAVGIFDYKFTYNNDDATSASVALTVIAKGR